MLRAIGRHRIHVAALLACVCLPVATAHAQPASACVSTSLDAPIARAAARFSIPDTLIRAVIRVESGGVVMAISAKGAMGLMQLMPGTWAELRRRYALGFDPFDVCDNIFAGTAYLRELLDRYGDPGFLAAYNAGPGRYEAYLNGRPLPAETIAYVARLSGQMLPDSRREPLPAAVDPDAWRRGALFVGVPASHRGESSGTQESSSSERRLSEDSPPSNASRDGVFVPRTVVPK